MSRTLSIVVPCYNEQEVLLITHKRIEEVGTKAVSDGLCDAFEVVYVDDGSSDDTFPILLGLSKQQEWVKVVRLSTNFGHQNALIAGYTHAVGDWICSIDADLQDPPEVMLEMLRHMNHGADMVFAVRTDRDNDTWFKRTTAELFYRLMAKFGVKTIPNHADFRMFTKEIRDVFAEYTETNLFLRATFASMGFTTHQVSYARPKRAAGKTKYPFRKMLEFAVNGVTSFSVVPLRLCTLTGLVLSLAAIVLMLWSIYTKVVMGAVAGWTSIVAPVYFLGGIQLMFMGVIGEYIGKIYLETKSRPRFLVRTTINVKTRNETLGRDPR
jgi:glycosyltransferase involved in cell wall biosynthesis